MKRMIWMNPLDRTEETVFLLGVFYDGHTVNGCIMHSDEFIESVPVQQLKLRRDDYNKIFAE